MVVPVAVPQDPPGVALITAQAAATNPNATYTARTTFYVTAPPSNASVPSQPPDNSPPTAVPGSSVPPAAANGPAAGNTPQQAAGTQATADPQTSSSGSSATDGPPSQDAVGITRTSSNAARVAQVKAGASPGAIAAAAGVATLIVVVGAVLLVRHRRTHPRSGD